MPLTAAGREDVSDIGAWLVSEKVQASTSHVFCSALPQVLETAELLSEFLRIPFEVRTELKNISLGVLDGLSKQEAFDRFPEVAMNLELWRAGKLGIDQFSIPNAETPDVFYGRVSSFMDELLTFDYQSVIIIGTRSVGVAITNKLANKLLTYDPEKYTRYLFDPGSTSKFHLDASGSSLHYLNRTDYLKRRPLFPDE